MLIPSRYNHEVQCDGRRYLYNMLSVGLIELQDGMNIEDICKADPNAELQLKALGFLVEDGWDEFAKYQYFFDAKRYGEAPRRIKIVLIPTYGCNLRCPYCYQGQDKSSNRLGQEGAERILRFLDVETSRLKSNNAIDSINIGLFGGEPMMDKAAISRFCEGATAIANRVMIPIQFDMTTNLTLLDQQMVELIKRFSIFTQVTLDGPRQYHDKRRVTEYGVGTYDRILQNLKWLNEVGLKKYIQIRINL